VTRAVPCAAAWLALLAASLLAQEDIAGAVQTVDGRILNGRVQVDADGKVRVTAAGGTVTELTFGDLLRIDQSTTVPAGAPWRGNEVWLRSGLRLPFSTLSGKFDPALKTTTVTLQLACGVPLDVSLTQLRAVRLCGEDKAPAALSVDLQHPGETSDFLFVDRDGKPQRFSVVIESVAGTSMHFNLRGAGYDVDVSRVTAVVFGKSTGFPPDRQPKPRAAVHMATGERLEGRLLSLDSVCRLRLDEGAELSLPRQQIVAIGVASQKLTWVSELKPAVQQVPAFDRTWPWTVDATSFGPGLRLGGQEYEHGVCVVPRTTLTYDLGGRFDLFEATLGIDDRGGPEANAIFRVRADGRTLFESPAMTLGMAPVTVKLQLQKCKQLVLEADFGKNYDLGDLCVFANARVVQL